MQTSQDKILNYCLKNCVFDGWTEKLLTNASISAGLDENYWKILFPKGTEDLLDFYEETINKSLEAEFSKPNYANLRTHEKIRELIKIRLQILSKNKTAIQTIVQTSLLNCPAGLHRLYNLSDKIWRLAGDTASDWNFYSKRLLLSSVYSTTLIFWLNDITENNSATWQFLDRRLAEVAKFGKATAKLKEFTKKITLPPLRR